MYNIKIINTSNNTRIILSELKQHSTSSASSAASVAVSKTGREAPTLSGGVIAGAKPQPHPSLNRRVGPIGLNQPAKLLAGLRQNTQRAPRSTANGGAQSASRFSSSRTPRASQMLFQLTSGQLGFKGATRKSSFVVSKLIQQFFNFIKSRSDNFRNIHFNIFFVGINPKDGVIMDQIRLALPKLIYASRMPTTAVGRVNARGIQNFYNWSHSGPAGKFYDITPIPFNGCKFKKSRRK